MKKLMFVAVAVMTMTACSNEEDVIVNNNPTEIGFATASKTLARNTPSDDSNFTGQNFVATGVHTDKTGTISKYFENVKCTKASSIWKSGYFWPLQGDMQFAAYSTDTTIDNTNIWGYNTDNTLKDVTLDFTTNQLNGYDDVLVSNLKSNVSCLKSSGANADVPMTLQHALAWVFVNLKAKDAASAAAVKVYDVRVNNPYLSGNVVATLNVTKTTFAWSGLCNQKSAESVGTPAVNQLTTTASAWNNGLLLPTQNMTSITLEYTITNGTTESDHMTYTIDLDTATQWLAGTKYTYNVTIGLNEITFTAEVGAFDANPTNKEI